MSLTDEIQVLHQLHQSGAIDDAEFSRAKAKLLNESTEPGSRHDSSSPDREAQTRQWALALHLSQFAGYALPLAGMVVPILIWQLKKAELPEIDAHGKEVANWIVTELIAFAVFLVLSLALIGIPLLFLLGVLGLLFPIIGAVKASDGDVWRYPGSFRFFT